MKGKIKGHIPTSNCTCLNNREALQSYMGLFSKYFERVGNWMSNVEVSNLNNTVLCYSKVVKITNCSSCSSGTCVAFDDKWKAGPADPIWEHSFLNQKKPEFMRVEVDKFERRLCNKSIIFSLKGDSYNRVIAEFCPSRKILLTTDWTHDESKIEFVEYVLGEMAKMGLVGVRPNKIVKPIITLGADPELEYIDPDTKQVLHCGEAGIQDRVLMSNGSGQGRIGKDGSQAQREIRPEPATTPEGLIDNIDKLIKEAMDEQWSMKGDRWSLGGHIHVGGIQESRGYINLLDHYLAPLAALNSAARASSSYGKPGDYRRQEYGIEYRAPPVGWLASKKLAYLTLKIVKLAAEKHYLGEDIELTDDLNRDLTSLGLSMEEVVDFFAEINTFKEKGLPDDMKVAWGHKILPKFVVEFRDSWSSDVKDYIKKFINDVAKEEELGGRVVLYGLSSDRGNCFSVTMAHMQGIDMPDNYGFMPPLKSGAGINHVGMPASIRSSLSEAKKMKEIVIEVIKRTVNPPKITKKKAIKKEDDIEAPAFASAPPYVPSSWTYVNSGSTLSSSPFAIHR